MLSQTLALLLLLSLEHAACNMGVQQGLSPLQREVAALAARREMEQFLSDLQVPPASLAASSWH